MIIVQNIVGKYEIHIVIRARANMYAVDNGDGFIYGAYTKKQLKLCYQIIKGVL